MGGPFRVDLSLLAECARYFLIKRFAIPERTQSLGECGDSG